MPGFSYFTLPFGIYFLVKPYVVTYSLLLIAFHPLLPVFYIHSFCNRPRNLHSFTCYTSRCLRFLVLPLLFSFITFYCVPCFDSLLSTFSRFSFLFLFLCVVLFRSSYSVYLIILSLLPVSFCVALCVFAFPVCILSLAPHRLVWPWTGAATGRSSRAAGNSGVRCLAPSSLRMSVAPVTRDG